MALGEWNVDGMMDAMPSKLLSEWMVYFALEPFGPLRDDLRAGRIASLIANINTNPKDRPTPWKPSDFFTSLEMDSVPEEPEEVDPEAQANMLMQKLMAALGGGPPGMVGSA